MIRDIKEVRRCPYCGEVTIAVPVFRCGRCGEDHPLRAFYYQKNGSYYAECIDLDLISRGSTPEEAVGNLQEAMLGYIEAVVDGPTKGLFPRKSPLSHRLRYHWSRLSDRYRQFITHSRAHDHLIPTDATPIVHC